MSVRVRVHMSVLGRAWRLRVIREMHGCVQLCVWHRSPMGGIKVTRATWGTGSEGPAGPGCCKGKVFWAQDEAGL